jgi:crooked neck
MGDEGGGKGKGKGKPMRGVPGLGVQAEVRNRAVAEQQITAEQLLRDAAALQTDEVRAPKQRIVDEDELLQYRVAKRKNFENVLRRQRMSINVRIKYAHWEASQQAFRRARSIFERALQVDYQNVSLWLKYVEMEMSNKFVQHARNLFDRVCQLLPRVDQFWYKYAYMEELLGNYAGCRTVYERWMEWRPPPEGWLQYVKFEERCKEIALGQKVFERYVSCHPGSESILRLCKFEEKHNNLARCRAGFEKGVEILGEESLDEKFYIRFAQFEERQKETERARMIYKLALDKLPKTESNDLYRKYVAFEKQHGDREEIEDVVVNKRRAQYENAIKDNPKNYDVWFDYARLEENADDPERVREVYERAVAEAPPIKQKRYWRRYIYLWLNYAIYEETEAKDPVRARKVYDAAILVVPHKIFSFAKLWQLYAEFELRQLDIEKARLIYGRAIGECGKEKIFANYSDMELRLGNVDRCRKIYSKYLETHPLNPKAWCKFVDLEVSVGEVERGRALCEMAIKMEGVAMPELLWKRYIDLEIEEEDAEAARALFERLLESTSHVRVFISFADFEAKEDIDRARQVIARGERVLKDSQDSEARAMLLEHAVKIEDQYGDASSIKEAKEKIPQRVKRKRQIVDDAGEDQGYEEYTEFIFPEDGKAAQGKLKILQKAAMWKQRKIAEEN